MMSTKGKVNTPKADRTAKEDLIQLLIDMGCIQFRTRAEVPDHFELKVPTRKSPIFLNMRKVDDGTGMLKLGATYLASIIKAKADGVKIDAIYGPPEAGLSIVVAIDYMSELAGERVPYAFTRKVPKGGASKRKVDPKELEKLPKYTPAEMKALVLGREPDQKKTQKVLIMDDRDVVDEPPWEAISSVRRMGLEPVAIMMQKDAEGLTAKDIQELTGISTIGVAKEKGSSPLKTGDAYTTAIMNTELVNDSNAVPAFDIVYGANSEGIVAAVATTMSLQRTYSVNVPWSFTRAVAKAYGTGTGTVGFVDSSIGAPAEEVKLFGCQLTKGMSVPIADDMMTEGKTKDESKEFLEKTFGVEVTALLLTAERQEVNVKGSNAADAWAQKHGIPIYVQVGNVDIHRYCVETDHQSKEGLERTRHWMRVYGTKAARDYVGGIQPSIVEKERGVVVACDVNKVEDLEQLVQHIRNVDGIVAVNIGSQLVTRYGLPRLMELTRFKTPDGTKAVVVYNHQSTGTNIPDLAEDFMKNMKEFGVDYAIVFPQAGPETERATIYRAFDSGLGVIVGGYMTHPGYSEDEGGFITQKGIIEMYRIAASAGVSNFMLPVTKSNAELDVPLLDGTDTDNTLTVKMISEIDAAIREEGIECPTYVCMGIGAQRGSLKDIIAALPKDKPYRLLAQVGRDITRLVRDKKEEERTSAVKNYVEGLLRTGRAAA